MRPEPAHPLHLAAGFALWAIWFTAIYGGLSVACEVAAPPAGAGALTWVNAGIGVLTLATVIALLVGAATCWRSASRPGVANIATRRFVARASAALYLCAALAALFVGLPAAVLPPCG